MPKTPAMKIVQLTTDARDHYKHYDRSVPYFGTAPEALLQGFAALPEVEVHVVSCTHRPMRSPEKLADNIFFHSVVVPRIGWTRTFYQGCIRAVRKKLREIRPDIVHGQGTELDCAISAVFSGYPNVVTIHGNMVQMARLAKGRSRFYLGIAAWLENIALSRTNGVFCNSTFTEALVKPRTSKVWPVPNPVRKNFFELPISNHRRRTQVLLNVGSVSAHKRQVELVELAERLHRQGVKCRFEFVGQIAANDPYGTAFLKKIELAKDKGFAAYRGFMERDDLIKAYDSADALVHVSAAESFGLVVAEALSRNLKFFGSRVGGISDIAENVEGAELFSRDDWTGLGAAIASWVEKGCPQPSTAAATMRKRYRPDQIARRHLEIYEEVLRSST